MNGITVTCFAASYAVALACEVTRLFFRSGVRGALMLTFAGAGLVAHSLYLAARLTSYGGGPVAGWFEWFLLAAWILAAAYLYLTFYHPRNPFGLFILPLVLGLIALGYVFRFEGAFGGARLWGLVHGLSLLMGTVVVLIGFVAGLMYLIEANRLKHKRPPAGRFRLPSLEWAEKVNGRTLVFSTILLGIGVLSGLALNAINHSQGAMALPWSDPVVWSSGLLLAWLLAAAAFNFVYRPARRGRKVAYLTLASMIFLLLALGVILLVPSKHPSQQAFDKDERVTGICCNVGSRCRDLPGREFRKEPKIVAVARRGGWL
ncbi:MAG: cytochrome c biogenesis protein CcsA [Planctomycetota bacterium]|nr:cytochrome c biogenesis protein CcsA [Planctomycetota bacterium]